MHAMKVHTGGKDIGVAGQSQGGEQTAIRASPDADSFGIDIRQTLQIPGPSQNVLVLGRTTPTTISRLAEGAPVHDAETIVYRQHHITQAGQILILSIGVVVVVHVVEGGQHLAYGATVNKDQGRMPLLRAGAGSARDKKLPVNLQAIFALECDSLGLNQL